MHASTNHVVPIAPMLEPVIPIAGSMVAYTKHQGVLAPGETSFSTKRHLDAINNLLARLGKGPVQWEDVLVRPIRLTGNQVTANYTRFKDSDLRRMVAKVPGIPLLVGHDTESLPIGTFYKATLTEDEEDLWLDTWVFFLNDEEGRKITERIDAGVYNEASIGWAYTRAECSICNRDYYSGYPLKYFVDVSEADKLSDEHDICLHVAGEKYNGKLCYIWTTGEVTPLEGSIVYRGAHPGTRVGGMFAQANHNEPIDAPLRKAAAKLAFAMGKRVEAKAGYVPPDPPDADQLDEDPSWEAPTFRDFLSYLGKDEGTRWEELSVEERKFIMRHFAWAPTDDPRDWTFTDLKLPHHKVGGVVSWGGVKAAAQRLAATDISSADKEKVRTHLGKHYRQFGRTPPWEAEDSMEDASVNASAQAQAEVPNMELKEQLEALQAEVQRLKEELDRTLGERANLEHKLTTMEAIANVGRAYLASLVEEAVSLRISLEGAEAAEAYEAVLRAWADGARADVLKAEVERLRKLKEKAFPGGRLSVETPAEKPSGETVKFVRLSGFKVGR